MTPVSSSDDLIRQRARHLCEYCHSSEQWQYVRFTVDHVAPLAQGGGDGVENLALACFFCNRRKSNRTAARDPVTGEAHRLFNPRVDAWSDHFCWSLDRLYIVGTTAVGRATLALLDFNRERVVAIRAADLLVGRHPPPEDPVASG